MSRERSRSPSRRREWSPTRMREPDVVYMLEIQEFELPPDRDDVIVRQWPHIYGRTREAVYEWFDFVDGQRECLFYLQWTYVGQLHAGRRPARGLRV